MYRYKKYAATSGLLKGRVDLAWSSPTVMSAGIQWIDRCTATFHKALDKKHVVHGTDAPGKEELGFTHSLTAKQYARLATKERVPASNTVR